MPAQIELSGSSQFQLQRLCHQHLVQQQNNFYEYLAVLRAMESVGVLHIFLFRLFVFHQ
jgi:hypothetical protein